MKSPVGAPSRQKCYFDVHASLRRRDVQPFSNVVLNLPNPAVQKGENLTGLACRNRAQYPGIQGAVLFSADQRKVLPFSALLCIAEKEQNSQQNAEQMRAPHFYIAEKHKTLCDAERKKNTPPPLRVAFGLPHTSIKIAVVRQIEPRNKLDTSTLIYLHISGVPTERTLIHESTVKLARTLCLAGFLTICCHGEPLQCQPREIVHVSSFLWAPVLRKHWSDNGLFVPHCVL